MTEWLHIRIGAHHHDRRPGDRYVTVWTADGRCVGKLATASVETKTATGKLPEITVTFIGAKIGPSVGFAPDDSRSTPTSRR